MSDVKGFSGIGGRDLESGRFPTAQMFGLRLRLGPLGGEGGSGVIQHSGLGGDQRLPEAVVAKQGVGEHDELADDGGDRDLVRFAAVGQPLVKDAHVGAKHSRGVVFRIILHDDFRIISDANLVIIQIVSCRRELGARGLTEAAGSGKFPSGGTDDSDLFCFAADLQLNRGLDGSAVGWQGVVRSGTVFCRSRLRGLAGPVGSGVGIAVAGRSSL